MAYVFEGSLEQVGVVCKKLKLDETEEKWKIELGDEERCVFREILEKIYDNLSYNDLLNCTLVSKTWQDCIGHLESYSKCTKLIYDSQNCAHQLTENHDAIKNSKRIYKHIDITVWNKEKERDLAEQIVTKYAKFLTHLKLVKFGGYNSILNVPLEMPFIEELEVQVVCGRMTGIFLTNCFSLKKLVINGVSSRCLNACLAQNADLKELTIYENAFISYFKEDISEKISFQLTKLQVLDHINQKELCFKGEFSAQYWSRNQRINFLKVLSTQKQLTALHLDVCNADIVHEILSMSTIKMLEMNKITGILEPMNGAYPNIEIFLTDANETSTITLVTLLTFLPKIQSIFIQTVSSENELEILDDQNICKELKKLYFCEGDLVSVRTRYGGNVSIVQSTKSHFMNLFDP